MAIPPQFLKGKGSGNGKGQGKSGDKPDPGNFKKGASSAGPSKDDVAAARLQALEKVAQGGK